VLHFQCIWNHLGLLLGLVCVCVFSNLNAAIFVFDSILVTVVVCNSNYLNKWTENKGW
jgi:hypothetical protein